MRVVIKSIVKYTKWNMQEGQAVVERRVRVMLLSIIDSIFYIAGGAV